MRMPSVFLIRTFLSRGASTARGDFPAVFHARRLCSRSQNRRRTARCAMGGGISTPVIIETKRFHTPSRAAFAAVSGRVKKRLAIRSGASLKPHAWRRSLRQFG